MRGSVAVVSVKMWRHFIAVAILVLFLSELQCNYFLVYAGASHATRSRGRRLRTLQEENKHAGRISKLRPVHPVSFMISSESVATSQKRSPSRRKVTSYLGGWASTSRSRQEVESLTAFRTAIDNDPMGALKSWHPNGSSACAWAGVVCSTQHAQIPNQVHVIGLELRGSQLVGNLKSVLQVLGNLSFLQRLDLSDNVFLGSIPGASLASYSKLSYLNVSHNNLTGPIPSQLGHLVNLEGLDMEENNLTGEIPVSLANCTLLRVLNLGWNFLEGEIPPVLGRLSNLQFLSLHAKIAPGNHPNWAAVADHSLTGSIPPVLGNCSSLTSLNLQYNSHLGGELPPDLSRPKRLQELWLSNCNFGGALPMWLGNLTSLSALSVANNWFHGEIPDVMGQLQDLSVLALGRNNLSGMIPISITNCTKLTAITIERTNLTGEVPPQLGLLKNLETLSLDYNSLTGVLPSSIANCSALTVVSFGQYLAPTPQTFPSWMGSLASLQYLYLAAMNLQGEIPGVLGQLSNLVFLHLGQNNLSGEIPSSLVNCTSLNILDLADNQLTGEIPPGIGQLSYLTWLLLPNNFLTGTFPAFVANLTQLKYLAIGGNSLTGKIDADFGRLEHLQEVWLQRNQFDGSIPEALSNCSNLLRIDLTSNNLTGEIPSSMGNLTRLVELRLGLNNIGGMIPVDVVKWSRLVNFDLTSNVFQGSVLPSIGQLSTLQFLSLAGNNFSGVVPSSLGNCSQIRTLDLSYNQIIGTVPGDILSKMIPLISLNLSHNRFFGSWPRQLSQMTQLQEIDFALNNLLGSIPPSIDGYISLVRLDISFNMFTGVIPQSLESLPALQFLNASYNDFEGPIPESVVLKANLTGASFLGNPKLCGVILGSHRTCSNSSRSCQGFKCEAVWIPTMCGVLGAILIALGILCSVNIIHGVSDKNQQRDLMLNFAPHIMRVSQRDVLASIQGGEENVIGMGAKSVVYKGVLPSPGAPEDTFAVKVLRSRSEEHNCEDDVNIKGRPRESDLVKEVQALAQVRHRNILKVFSFCSTPNVEALILEYMPNGCLDKHLHGLGDACHLTWPQRFNIAMGVAEAMVYLHHGNQIPLIHRDLKPNNILLDSDFEPKVADFGLSKFVGENRDGEATASTICGTIGYMPPEYATGTTVSTKGDVYSYGIVLLELLTGVRPTSWDNLRPSGSSNSRDYRSITEFFEESSLQLLNSTLKHEATIDSHKNEQMMLLQRVALFCTRRAPERRPSMVDVLGMLTQIKETGLVAIPPRTVTDLANETTGFYDDLANQTTSV